MAGEVEKEAFTCPGKTLSCIPLVADFVHGYSRVKVGPNSQHSAGPGSLGRRRLAKKACTKLFSGAVVGDWRRANGIEDKGNVLHSVAVSRIISITAT